MAIWLAVLGQPARVFAQTLLDAQSPIHVMESRLWGKTNQGEFTMMIVVPDWRRTLELDVRMHRPVRTLYGYFRRRRNRVSGRCVPDDLSGSASG